MAMTFLKDMEFEPKGNIAIDLVSDQECGGVYGILGLLKDGHIKADIGITADPSDGRIKLGFGGVMTCQIKIFGNGGTASVSMNTSFLLACLFCSSARGHLPECIFFAKRICSLGCGQFPPMLILHLLQA